MKTARIVVLVVAVAAGGGAALLAGRGGDEPPPAPVAAPQEPRIETVDVLVAKDEIQLGQSINAQNMQWQLWPVAAASPVFIRKSDKPNAIDDLTGAIARSP